MIHFVHDLHLRFGNREAFVTRRQGGWDALTYADVYTQTLQTAFNLRSMGVKKGDHVALLAASCNEFVVGFFALSFLGAVTVLVDSKLSETDSIYVIKTSKAVMLLSADDTSQKLAEKWSTRLENHLPTYRVALSPVSEVDFTSRSAFHDSLKADDIALVAFTSGSGGSPKGVMHFWKNLEFQINTLAQTYMLSDDLRMLSILPVNHLLEFVGGMLLPFACGGTVYYANTIFPQQIIQIMKEKRIRDMVAVPMFLAAFKKGIEVEVNSKKLSRWYFSFAAKLARLNPSIGWRRLVFWPLLRSFGGSLRRFISGGATLEPSIARFYALMGIEIYEGYGLTETAPVVSTNRPGHRRIGTVGKPIAGVEVRLAPETKEILVRGPNVMCGYFNDPVSTQACLDQNGWFNTGDVGEFDDQGFLRIVGRTKDLIVLGNGKKISPVEVEQELLEYCNLIEEVCVLGAPQKSGHQAGLEVITAVIVPNEEMMTESARAESLKYNFLRNSFHQALAQMSQYKRPSQIVVLENQRLPKTPTTKIKRNVVRQIIQTQGVYL